MTQKGQYNACPVCGAAPMAFPSEFVDRGGGVVCFPAECQECGAQWLQRFVYAGDEEIEPLEE